MLLEHAHKIFSQWNSNSFKWHNVKCYIYLVQHWCYIYLAIEKYISRNAQWTQVHQDPSFRKFSLATFELGKFTKSGKWYHLLYHYNIYQLSQLRFLWLLLIISKWRGAVNYIFSISHICNDTTSSITCLIWQICQPSTEFPKNPISTYCSNLGNMSP